MPWRVSVGSMEVPAAHQAEILCISSRSCSRVNFVKLQEFEPEDSLTLCTPGSFFSLQFAQII